VVLIRPPALDLRKIGDFVHVAGLGSISQAAPQLGYSQPGLSQRIQTVELALQCQLFIRRPQGVELTSAGTGTLPYARMILSINDLMLAAARDPMHREK
jgi:DNA-binding transcriptional LysR family regulator